MLTLTEKQAAKLGIKPRKEKYNRTKKAVDGIKFDSKKEADYYSQLLLLKKAGKIKKIELQPIFELQPHFRCDGKMQRAIKYIADFRITWADGHVEVVDVKGMRTKIYLMKRKMLLYKYPNINFKEV